MNDEVEKWKRRANGWRRKAWHALNEVRRLAGEGRVDEMIENWDAQDEKERKEDGR